MAAWTSFALALACASSLAAQAAPCDTPNAQPCDARRWRDDTSPSQPMAASEPDPEAEPWSAMLARQPFPDEEQERTWYGWQNLIADGIAIGSVLVLEDVSVAVGIGIGLLVSPILHFSHDNNFAGSLSFGLRALSGGLFLFGFLVGTDEIDFGDDEETTAGVTAVAGLVGYAVTVVLDASLLSFEEPRLRPSYGVLPWVDPRRSIAGLRFALAL